MGTHYLKENDTRPVLQVALKNPDETAYDLTGASSMKLFIRLSDGTELSARTMVAVGDDTDGVVRYTWVAGDWDDLIVGEHEIEYEVIDSSGGRSTFPNAGYDTLLIVSDIGDG